VAVGLLVARHAVRPLGHPSFTGQSLTRASVKLLGAVGMEPIPRTTAERRSETTLFGAPPKFECRLSDDLDE
jgi:hypothetical protein